MTRNILFTPVKLGRLPLSGRIIRAATYEAMADADGCPQPELGALYHVLAEGGCAMITTGFTATSRAGRAMQPRQAGIYDNRLIRPWREIVNRTKNAAAGINLIMQLAHAGRQTRAAVTGQQVLGAGNRPCSYFHQKLRAMSSDEIVKTIHEFSEAAARAREAGFDGVQLHAAHGYLLHQFLSPWTNKRQDRWRDGRLLLESIIEQTRKRCGRDFPILVKLSWADDNQPGITLPHTIETARALDRLEIDGIEVSYGTMEYPLNIIRGGFPVQTVLRVNPLFNRYPGLLQRLWKLFLLPRYRRIFHSFREGYNLPAALAIAGRVRIPVYPVGGIRSLEMMQRCVGSLSFPAVALCRPLIHDPAWPKKLNAHDSPISGCTNCNLCTVQCDGSTPLRCYQPDRPSYPGQPDLQDQPGDKQSKSSGGDANECQA